MCQCGVDTPGVGVTSPPFLNFCIGGKFGYFLDENVWILINISLKFVPRSPINNIPTLVQVMAWCRPSDKPLSELMMVRLQTHICVTRPQWLKSCSYVTGVSTANRDSPTPRLCVIDAFKIPKPHRCHKCCGPWAHCQNCQKSYNLHGRHC